MGEEISGFEKIVVKKNIVVKENWHQIGWGGAKTDFSD